MMNKSNRNSEAMRWLAAVAILILIPACDTGPAEPTEVSQKPPVCDADNGGLQLPPGFCAAVVADNLGIVRHIAVRETGILYASLRNRSLNVGGLLVLEDTDDDLRIDEVMRVGDEPGMGIRLYGDYLYFASDARIIRYPLNKEDAGLSQEPEVVVDALPVQKQHSGKPFAITPEGDLLVNIGSKTNACQQDDRKPGQAGLDPCPELDGFAGIWRFDAHRLNQTFADGQRYASGIRNAYAIDWQSEQQRLYVVQHGRDHLNELWPEQFSEQQEKRLPAEELIEVLPNQSYAWPYCYYDPDQQQYVLAPEYGGDGSEVGRCESFPPPVIGFPAHYGPNDLVFYSHQQFPQRYHGGAFIAFHGSYLMNAEQQVGYQVVFVPYGSGRLGSDWEVFADEFIGPDPIKVPQDADYRPTGLAVGPEGALYISDSVQGRIWRVIYQGQDQKNHE